MTDPEFSVSRGPGIVPDEDLDHEEDCDVLSAGSPSGCTCGAYAAQQMVRLETLLRRTGVLS